MGDMKKGGKARIGMQSATLCISTAMVLVLLGLAVLSVLSGRNLSSYVKENLVVSVMLDNGFSDTEARQMCRVLGGKPYSNKVEYVSSKQALEEGTAELGVNPEEFVGENPFMPSVELTLKSAYANNDSLEWISAEISALPKVAEVNYQEDLIDKVNANIAKVGTVLLVLALLLTFVSFSLINNTVKLGIYSRRFSIHTMKLVGASWSFIRAPFVRQSVAAGLIAAVVACAAIAGCVYGLYRYDGDILIVVTWPVLAATGVAVVLFGVTITAVCAYISASKFLRMTAGELYKI